MKYDTATVDASDCLIWSTQVEAESLREAAAYGFADAIGQAPEESQAGRAYLVAVRDAADFEGGVDTCFLVSVEPHDEEVAKQNAAASAMNRLQAVEQAAIAAAHDLGNIGYAADQRGQTQARIFACAKALRDALEVPRG